MGEVLKKMYRIVSLIVVWIIAVRNFLRVGRTLLLEKFKCTSDEDEKLPLVHILVNWMQKTPSKNRLCMFQS